ncbi:selO [Scenedesmus sp. PABB004]|nr:selO [Scenedesmus sp. PABB004]
MSLRAAAPTTRGAAAAAAAARGDRPMRALLQLPLLGAGRGARTLGAAAAAARPRRASAAASAAAQPASAAASGAAQPASAAAAAAAQPGSAAAAATPPRTLEAMRFDNTFVRELPGDPDPSNVLRQVEGALFSRVAPTPAGGEPRTVAYSAAVAALLGLDPAECERPEFALVMSGAAPLPGSEPYAQTYGGHQFGSWAGQLGDGRAITLGEVVNAAGKRWELQLKGAGRTPYSRRADGRAVMRSSLREFVCSEAMAALGVPTTRALCCVGTGAEVYRDMFYDGNARLEPGAVVCRVAPSFVRFGTFQLPASRGGDEMALVGKLADYVIRHHYPELQAVAAGAERYEALLREVSARTGRLVAMWQTLGWVHGVLNTDNCSILGLTIDYGPFGFIDAFAPDYTPNTTDFAGRRYCYSNQPQACQWNCVQLANALFAAGLVRKEEAEAALEAYADELVSTYNARMAAKLGLAGPDPLLAKELLRLMARSGADFTNTFRALAFVPTAAEEAPGDAAAAASGNEGGAGAAAARTAGLPARLVDALTGEALDADAALVGDWAAWLGAWRARLAADGEADAPRMARQRAASPKFVPRQHLLQYAIEAAEAGDFSETARLLEVCAAPYEEQPGADPKYSAPPPPDMIRPGVCPTAPPASAAPGPRPAPPPGETAVFLRPAPPPGETAVFFARAPPHIGEDDLAAEFGRFGRVQEINLFRKWQTAKRHKGCGIVVFGEQAAAVAALDALDGQHVWPGAEAPLVVEWLDRTRQQNAAALQAAAAAAAAAEAAEAPAGQAPGARLARKGRRHRGRGGRSGQAKERDSGGQPGVPRPPLGLNINIKQRAHSADAGDAYALRDTAPLWGPCSDQDGHHNMPVHLLPMLGREGAAVTGWLGSAPAGAGERSWSEPFRTRTWSEPFLAVTGCLPQELVNSHSCNLPSLPDLAEERGGNGGWGTAAHSWPGNISSLASISSAASNWAGGAAQPAMPAAPAGAGAEACAAAEFGGWLGACGDGGFAAVAAPRPLLPGLSDLSGRVLGSACYSLFDAPASADDSATALFSAECAHTLEAVLSASHAQQAATDAAQAAGWLHMPAPPPPPPPAAASEAASRAVAALVVQLQGGDACLGARAQGLTALPPSDSPDSCRQLPDPLAWLSPGGLAAPLPACGASPPAAPREERVLAVAPAAACRLGVNLETIAQMSGAQVLLSAHVGGGLQLSMAGSQAEVQTAHELVRMLA